MNPVTVARTLHLLLLSVSLGRIVQEVLPYAFLVLLEIGASIFYLVIMCFIFRFVMKVQALGILLDGAVCRYF